MYSTVGRGHAYEIYNPSNEVLPIDYYYYSGSANQSAPNTSGSVNTIGTSVQSPCQYVEVPGDGDLDGPLDPFFVIPNNPDGNPGGTDADALYTALGNRNSPYARLAQVALLIEQGDYSTASTHYNSIAAAYSLSGVGSRRVHQLGQPVDCFADSQAPGRHTAWPVSSRAGSHPRRHCGWRQALGKSKGAELAEPLRWPGIPEP